MSVTDLNELLGLYWFARAKLMHPHFGVYECMCWAAEQFTQKHGGSIPATYKELRDTLIS